MIAEISIENFFSIKSVQKISFEPSADTFMSDEYSYEVKDGVRLLKVGIIYGANASGKTNILNAIEFFKMLVLRMPKDRTEKTGFKKRKDKDVNDILYQSVEVHPQF